MKLSIIICVYNKSKYTQSCLNDLSKLKDHEIIVVDNNSSDDTESVVKSFPSVVYIKNKENLGFGAANNIGYDIAKSNNVLFLNNDIRVKDNFENWTDCIIEKCNDGLVGPTMGQLDANYNFIKETKEQLNNNLCYLSGWCIASSKANFDTLANIDSGKVWNEKFFAYFEDTYLSFVARKANIKLIQQNVPVVHFGKVTSSQINTKKLYKDSQETFKKLLKAL